ENNAAASTYSINDTLLTRGAARVQQSGLENVSILGGRGNNTYNVEKTFVDTPVSITGGAGDDTFRVTPTSLRLTDIAGLLTVAGGAGHDSLSISDTAPSTTSASSSLTFLNLSRNGEAHISHPGIDELIYFGNDRGNTYNVESVATDTTVKLFGGAGNDTFRLAPTSRNLNDIGRSVTFIGGNRFHILEADDRNNPAPATPPID